MFLFLGGLVVGILAGIVAEAKFGTKISADIAEVKSSIKALESRVGAIFAKAPAPVVASVTKI